MNAYLPGEKEKGAARLARHEESPKWEKQGTGRAKSISLCDGRKGKPLKIP